MSLGILIDLKTMYLSNNPDFLKSVFSLSFFFLSTRVYYSLPSYFLGKHFFYSNYVTCVGAAIFLKISLLDSIDWLKNRHLILSRPIILPKFGSQLMSSVISQSIPFVGLLSLGLQKVNLGSPLSLCTVNSEILELWVAIFLAVLF